MKPIQLVVLITSFLFSVVLDPVAIYFFNKSWKGSFEIRVLNLLLGFVIGLVVWGFVWIGTRFTQPVFYAASWGLIYLLFSVIIPALLSNKLGDITLPMWFFLTAGIVSFVSFLVLSYRV